MRWLLNPACVFLQDHTQKAGDIVFHTFDRVIVRLHVDRSNVQREKLVMDLVEPAIPGFSVLSSGELVPTEEEQAPL